MRAHLAWRVNMNEHNTCIFLMMTGELDWQDYLDEHPIFLGVKHVTNYPTELSFSAAKESKNDEESNASSTPRRRQIMCMKDSDLIVACGCEIRMTCLADAKVSGGSNKTYKVCFVRAASNRFAERLVTGPACAKRRLRDTPNLLEPE